LRLRGFASSSLLGTAAVAPVSCHPNVLTPVGPVGDAAAKITWDATVIMLVIVVPTILVALAFAWWFRAGNTRARYMPEWNYSGRLELLVWSIPALTIMFLGGVIWIGSHQLEPSRPLPSKTPPLNVQVVSLDWRWLFIYPDQRIASINDLVIPVGTPVRFQITSSTVLNVFFVPQLGSMIYAMGGMATNLWLQADRPGTFLGQSAQISGDGFSNMRFPVRAVPPDQFNSWVSGVRAGGSTLDDRTYVALTAQSLDQRAYTFGSVGPNLFRDIVTHRLPPGPGVPQTPANAQQAPPLGTPEQQQQDP
jgi:cytochrome o ubiquinol oxidase subunit 2